MKITAILYFLLSLLAFYFTYDINDRPCYTVGCDCILVINYNQYLTLASFLSSCVLVFVSFIYWSNDNNKEEDYHYESNSKNDVLDTSFSYLKYSGYATPSVYRASYLALLAGIGFAILGVLIGTVIECTLVESCTDAANCNGAGLFDQEAFFPIYLAIGFFAFLLGAIGVIVGRWQRRNKEA